MDVAKKHAYCVIFHNEPKLLMALVALLDDERNDIFLMVDKKTDISIYNGITAHKAGLYYAERIHVRWGHISLIKAEYSVFECARRHGPYARYHLLSGVDMPIKSQDYIHEFFDSNPTTECIGFTQNKQNADDLKTKTTHYSFFVRHARSRYNILRRVFGYLDRRSICLQNILGIKRSYPYDTLKKGAEWVSITNDLVEYLLCKKREVLKNFRFICCADEIYKQTLVWNSKFRDNVYAIDDEYKSNRREIDWSRGAPYCWGSNSCANIGGGDLLTLRSSEALFARKFSSENMWIVDEIGKWY